MNLFVCIRAPATKEALAGRQYARSGADPGVAGDFIALLSASTFRWDARQRVADRDGAIALRPAVLIADEPTTALDVTIGAQILQLITVLQQRDVDGRDFITHDMSVVADIADRVLVMYIRAGCGNSGVEQIFPCAKHSLYTQTLLARPQAWRDARPLAARRFPMISADEPALLEYCRLSKTRWWKASLFSRFGGW